MKTWLNIALPKGRLGDKVYAMFARAGFECPDILEENRKLVRQFLQDEFISRGMIADYAIHEKDAGEDGIRNPHG